METRRGFVVGVLVYFVILAGSAGWVGAEISSPHLAVVTSGIRLAAFWDAVDGATGYTLYYAPYPYTGPESIGSIDMGIQTAVSGDLWPGAAFYVAVRARDSGGEGGFSNIEDFRMPPDPAASSGAYQVFGFNDSGMHCYDPDFSVFAMLPPFSRQHAQVIRIGEPPQILGSSVAVSYRAMADPTGSINTTSQGKTDFWDYVRPLFGVNPPVDEGLLGARMPGPGNVPRPFVFSDGSASWFSVDGLPITNLDDRMQTNPYPLMNVRAINPLDGSTLSSLPVVVPVSDETACDVCHATGEVAARLSGIQWSNNSNPVLQYRENILLLHDYRAGTSLFGHQPVLCSSCHYSFPLDLTLQGPTGPQATNLTMSRAMHQFHASRINTVPPSGNVCFYCHPGETTQCLRGAMATAGITCTDCHGNLFAVGKAGRRPWIDLPMCQSCHTGDALSNVGGQIIRRSTYTDSPNTATFITATNKRFAEQDGTLYSNSVTHFGVSCESCHGSPHAEWPTREANDNLTAISIQGHDGMIIECSACHSSGLALTAAGGPHGMHNVNNQSWVSNHDHFASRQACGTCHGANGQGTVISKAAVNRTFSAEDRGTVSIPKGTQIGCGLCHENVLGGGGGGGGD